MGSKELINLALKMLSCNQKELATRLGVSPAQVTKWKKGEYMSSEMNSKFRELLGLDENMDPSFIEWAGSLQDAKKWDALLHYLAEWARAAEETGYDTLPLMDEEGFLCRDTIEALNGMGVERPREFPKELEGAIEGDIDDYSWELFMENPYFSVIYEIYDALNDVYGFFAAYLESMMDDDDLLDYIGAMDSSLINLAACKIEVSKDFAPRMGEFKHKVIKECEACILNIKKTAHRKGYPLGAELMDLVRESNGMLGHHAEAKSLGINHLNAHPDIYMNEIIESIRLMVQDLSDIKKKLGIKV